jgi:hypothetical protein
VTYPRSSNGTSKALTWTLAWWDRRSQAQGRSAQWTNPISNSYMTPTQCSRQWMGSHKIRESRTTLWARSKTWTRMRNSAAISPKSTAPW